MSPPTVHYDPTDEEPKLLGALRAYWQAKRGARALPGRQDIVPSEIKSLLPFVVLVDVIAGGADFRYRLVGSLLHRYFPGVPTGLSMREALAPFGPETVEATLDGYRQVVIRRAPLRIRGDGAWFEQDPKYFDALLTPLASDGAIVDMIFGAFQFEWNFLRAATVDTAESERAMREAIGR